MSLGCVTCSLGIVAEKIELFVQTCKMSVIGERSYQCFQTPTEQSPFLYISKKLKISAIRLKKLQ